ncbi:unnamed protein product [Periconia digitata]|uniref:Uncharacterized protein n=1 Tax=Periconia digitata TaxID=1303443 RepID=A0A9W4UBK6_9PLEO|nr:unnamed protein product [Periconia digitata]
MITFGSFSLAAPPLLLPCYPDWIQQPCSSTRPPWARDISRQSFREHAPLITLDQAILINTPFVGSYYLDDPQSYFRSAPVPVALAVFARFAPLPTSISSSSSSSSSSCTSSPSPSAYYYLPDSLWLAIRLIYTCPRDSDRHTSLTWVRYSDFRTFLEHHCMKPSHQIFEPKQMFRTRNGEMQRGMNLDLRSVWREWRFPDLRLDV